LDQPDEPFCQKTQLPPLRVGRGLALILLLWRAEDCWAQFAASLTGDIKSLGNLMLRLLVVFLLSCPALWLWAHETEYRTLLESYLSTSQEQSINHAQYKAPAAELSTPDLSKLSDGQLEAIANRTTALGDDGTSKMIPRYTGQMPSSWDYKQKDSGAPPLRCGHKRCSRLPAGKAPARMKTAAVAVKAKGGHLVARRGPFPPTLS
jgi:hypothetical protein